MKLDGKRILIIDDNPDIHDDYQAVLCGGDTTKELSELEEDIFGESLYKHAREQYNLDSALQGQEGLALVESALKDHQPYSVAFVDMRMPPGWDGLETIERIFAVDEEIQVVICTAYTDYSRAQLIERLGVNDRLLFLKKPFEVVEVEQLAGTLRQKWLLQRQLRKINDDACRAKGEIEHHAKELALANRYKAKFATNVSHELFTPLNSIQTLVELLSENSDRNLSEKQIKVIEAIRNSGIQLTNIVADLMAIARFDFENSNDQDTQEVAVRELLSLSTEAFRHRAMSKGLDFAVDLPETLPIDFAYNATILFKMINILLSNAVKFTERGHINVCATMSRCDRERSNTIFVDDMEHGAQTSAGINTLFSWWEQSSPEQRVLIIEISDTGIGISKEQESAIFGSFKQADDTIEKKLGGFGLGLIQCRNQLRNHLGAIAINSEPGVGSRFRISLLEQSLAS
jgi:signal transduction histidine kinase